MEDHTSQKAIISGILASLLHHSSSSPGDTDDGLLFCHVFLITPSSLSDDFPADQSSSSDSSPTLVAVITDFISSGTTSSFYDSVGHIDVASLRRFLRLSPLSNSLSGSPLVAAVRDASPPDLNPPLPSTTIPLQPPTSTECNECKAEILTAGAQASHKDGVIVLVTWMLGQCEEDKQKIQFGCFTLAPFLCPLSRVT